MIRSSRSRVAWGAIAAGLAVSIGVFILCGAFIGAMEVTSIAWTRRSLSLLGIVPMFVGGWTTARLSVRESTGDALLHGLILWSSTAFVVLLLTMNGAYLFGASALLGGEETPLTYEENVREAWWAFAAVLLSLVAAMAGSVTATMRPHRIAWHWRGRHAAPTPST